MKAQPRILVIVGHRDLGSKIEGILDRKTLDVNRVESGASALVLVGNIHYDLLVIEAPLPDLTLADFMGSLRALDSTCSTSSALILSHENEIALPPGLVGAPIEVLPVDSPEQRIHQLISKFIGVASRRKGRVLAKFEVEVCTEKEREALESLNLSESGILLRGGQSIPVGGEVLFRFTLPGGEEPISGKAKVARHMGPAEPVPGIALHFSDLGEPGQALLRDFVLFGAAGPEAQVAGGS